MNVDITGPNIEKLVDSYVRLLLNAKYKGENPLDLLVGLTDDMKSLVLARFYETTVDIVLPPPVVVNDGRSTLWEFDSSKGYYWSQLRTFLLEDLERSHEEISSLDEYSDLVLQNLGNPKDEATGIPPIKGLVVGYVQSGKTANYTALIAKAFDAGYRRVIVLAGVHNLLRRQTQLRLENELGLVADSPSRRTASKTAQHGPLGIVRATTDDLKSGDFQYPNIDHAGLQDNRFLFVTKKNASVLRKLIKWIGKDNTSPTLIIDDEADQATPNTKGNRLPKEIFEDETADETGSLSPEEAKDLSPTEINKQIRILLGLFKNRSYVGYTATPFANVFMDDQALDVEAGEDLYPRDFIISLPKPKNYLGPEEFFGTEETSDESVEPLSSRVIQIVDDSEVAALDKIVSPDYQPGKAQLPDSLIRAIHDFFLATAIRRTIEGNRDASAMLVHSTRVTALQRILRDAIEDYVKYLRNSWRYDSEAKKQMKMDLERFLSSVADEKFQLSFEEIEEELDFLLEKFSYLPVLLINYDSEDQLDYEAQPNLTAIVVGGNKLSRGLTINGLIISYFVRTSSAPQADTLTQMGRFFGYKRAIAEITRIYTTEQLRESFRDAAAIEASLRRELAMYSFYGKKPKDFAPRVLKRAALMPTAKNKMKAVKEVGVSYSGDLIQTTSFPYQLQGNKTPKELLMDNYHLAASFLNELDSNLLQKSGNTFLWPQINSNTIIDFLKRFNVSDSSTRFLPSLIMQYISDSNNLKNGAELEFFNVALIGRSFDPELGVEDFGNSALQVGRISRSVDKGSKNSIGTLVNPLNWKSRSGDELIDMTSQNLANIEKRIQSDGGNITLNVRNERDPSCGLIMLYPISPNSIGKIANKANKDISKTLGQHLVGSEDCPTVIGLGLVFPFSRTEKPTYHLGPSGRAGEF